MTRGWVCRLQLLLGFASALIASSESRRTHDHILLFQIRVSPNLEAKSLIYTPQEQGGQLYLQALDFFIIAFYDSQGYGGSDLNSDTSTNQDRIYQPSTAQIFFES
jgi:hypothetical protein